jgi:hypothetical protein
MATDLGLGVTIEQSDINAGTGNYDSFLRIQNNGEEEGFNTDTPQLENNKDGNFTHSLLISSLQVVTVGGVNYYQIRLDLNETNSKTGPEISLDQLQLYIGDAALSAADLGTLTKVYDLQTDNGGSLALTDVNTGSGTDDYFFMIPVDLVDGGGAYLTLYADFSGADGGFEEFRALSQDFVPHPEINIVKETNGTDNACPNILAGENVTWTYTVTNPGNLALSNVVVTDDNGTPGNLLDDFTAAAVLSGGFNVGDANHNNLLDTNETWQFTATGTAGTGEYVNLGTASGHWASGDASGNVTQSESDCYFGATAAVTILKQTDGTDGACLNLLAGSTVNWTYDVTNTGDVGIQGSSVVISDDAGTPGTPGDDFPPDAVLDIDGYNTGDVNQNGVLDPNETWHYTASGTVTPGEYTNVASVQGTAFDDVGNTAPVTDDESDCYNGGTASIAIVKETNGTDNQCPVVMVGDTVSWTYAVSNDGDFGITNVVVTDDNGNGAGSDDFLPTYVSGDNGNNILDPGETWNYSATGVATLGHYENVATVTGTATDDASNTAPVTDSESDCYLGLEGPCPRTPGFWSHWTDFWNGTASVPKQAGQDDFPTADLLYQVDSTGDGTLDNVKGLLIGDYNHNGLTDNYGPDGLPGTGDDFQEDTVFVSLSNALTLINASNKQMSDGVVKVGRDVVATWLNSLMGSPIGDASDPNSPAHFINAAVNYLQTFGDSNSSNTYISGEVFDTYAAGHAAVKTSTAFWNSNIVGNSGAQIHSALDGYNNTGTINGTVYAADCDNPQFLNDFHAYALNGALFAA